MIQICDRAYHKNTDIYTMSEIGIPGIVLMERAAYALVQEVQKHSTKSERILAVCGSGNNGGDGVAAARILHLEGYSCDVLLLCGKHGLTEETKKQLEIAKNVGLTVYQISCDRAETVAGRLDTVICNPVYPVQCITSDVEFKGVKEYTILLDAIFGIGLARVIAEPYKSVIETINASDAFVVAADIPSGIDTDTGAVLGCAVQADVTVSFGFGKPGLYLYPGAEYAGKVKVKEIGFVRPQEPEYKITAYEGIEELPIKQRKADSHKGSYGKVLLIAGFEEMSGACCMSAEAAYRCGAGLVRVFTSEDAKRALQARVPELMVSSSDSADWKEKLEKQLAWADVIAIGPGLGMSELARNVLEMVLETKEKAVVLDADALNLLDGKFEKIPYNAVLTPHPAELSRLLQLSLAEIKKDRFGILRKAEVRDDIVLVCKDARTIISQGKSVCINLNGNSGMASGGSGDVLTGIIAALLASGMNAYDAACAGVRIHAEAGDMAAKVLSEHAMLATDIIANLSNVFSIIEKKEVVL